VILALLERYEEVSKMQASGERKVFVLERSIQAARRVFIEHNRHLLSEREYSLLIDLCLFGERYFESDLVRIYLKVPDHQMADRIRERGRPSEENIS
jgi:deoxyadenosine/deoxycytidine kinase